MTLLVQTPRNDAVIRKFGSYRSRMNALTGAGTNIQRRLSRGGLANYEPDLQATLLTLAQSDRQRVFYDVGAHIGLFSALLSTVYRGTGLQAYAFEPTPSTFARAVKLRDRNRLGYMVMPIAVSDSVGEAHLYLSTKAETSNSLNSGFRPGSTAVSVRCETIDSVVAGGAPAPTLMKIDVETFEPQVLSGAMDTITRHTPWITCEFLASADEGRLRVALQRLERVGYLFYRIVPETPWSPCTPAQVLAKRSSASGSRDWLAAPKPLSNAFFTRFQAWLEAVKKCTLATNTVTDDRAAVKVLTQETWNSDNSSSPRTGANELLNVSR
ncbi:FkbM family methyltransferase [Hansschlegelia plantiphila]|uniref:Methyltransferase FkbM domain-containing protein n=1 Tax=Hansschlegelia plantiphila TaxID=374655 RepID=A0A9W6MTV1_9HYPH|nr:FkbM family methyltransferase [Hansschlegelia plantiphila]GLK66744.1 hypothetical protein GCM10008179_03820 [Hansschlegelia plantiphila]